MQLSKISENNEH